MLGAHEKPDVSYADVGGLDMQKQEIREAVELPLTHFDLYKQIGIDPPRGVLLYGPPGTGKTMLVKAVANSTTASFIRVVGSEFVQKYLGEGPRMVRDVFRLARENSPAIIFIDEIDAIATKRFRRPDRRRSRSPAYSAGTAQSNGRLRSNLQRQSHHGHQPTRYPRPRTPPSRSPRP